MLLRRTVVIVLAFLLVFNTVCKLATYIWLSTVQSADHNVCEYHI